MTLTTALYLTDILENVQACFLIGLLLGAIIMTFAVIGYFINSDCPKDSDFLICQSVVRKWWIIALLAIICAAIPSKSTMRLMLATEYLNRTDLPEKAVKALELKLDDYIDEIKGKK